MRGMLWLIAALVAAVAARPLLRRLAQLVASRLVKGVSGRDAAASAAATAAAKGHPWFAATYDLVNRWSEAKVLSQFRPLIAGQATGQVLEIGAGTGANFPHYRAAERIVAIEPDPFMLERARRRAEQLGLSVEFHQSSAEALPFADASFDTVIATLVFCTVANPARGLAEVRRVLRPGGTFRFIEHVRADGSVARAQDLLTPLWGRVAAGCHLNRRTAEAIEAAGLEIVERREGRLLFVPLIVGAARPR